MFNSNAAHDISDIKVIGENMKTMSGLEEADNLRDGLTTFLCESVEDLIAVEKELKEDVSKKYENILRSLVIYNPFHPHYSSSDVVGTFPDTG